MGRPHCSAAPPGREVVEKFVEIFRLFCGGAKWELRFVEDPYWALYGDHEPVAKTPSCHQVLCGRLVGEVPCNLLPSNTLCIDDLESMLDESMVLSFNTEIEDGSVEEVAKQLMIIHEECLQGKFASIEKLRNSKPVTHAISQSKRVINDDDEDESSDDVSDMMVDEPKPEVMAVDKPNPREVPDEDGWIVISRDGGKRSG